MPISTARSKLFQLTDLVRKAGADTVVVFEQRGGLEGVALVREGRLAYLEARVTELENREQPAFTLAGSLSSDLDDAALDSALRAIRSEWAPGATKSRASTRASRKGRRSRP